MEKKINHNTTKFINTTMIRTKDCVAENGAHVKSIDLCTNNITKKIIISYYVHMIQILSLPEGF